MIKVSPVAAAAGSALVGVASRHLSLRALAATGGSNLERENFRGRTVNLAAGPALAAALTDAALSSVFMGGGRQAAAGAVATAAAGAVGLYDDLAEDKAVKAKGFRGHLGALRRGKLTTGAIKIIGIGCGGVAAALIAGTAREGTGSNPRRSAAANCRPAAANWSSRAGDLALNTVLIAGAANLANLLDLRPGRALKAATLSAAGLCAAGQGRAAAPLLGPVLAAVPGDLAEVEMLGDSGANALGAGLAVASLGLSRPTRATIAAAIVGLTAASERISFSAVIERNRLLAWLDGLGRRPAAVHS